MKISKSILISFHINFISLIGCNFKRNNKNEMFYNLGFKHECKFKEVNQSFNNSFLVQSLFDINGRKLNKKISIKHSTTQNFKKEDISENINLKKYRASLSFHDNDKFKKLKLKINKNEIDPLSNIILNYYIKDLNHLNIPTEIKQLIYIYWLEQLTNKNTYFEYIEILHLNNWNWSNKVSFNKSIFFSNAFYEMKEIIIKMPIIKYNFIGISDTSLIFDSDEKVNINNLKQRTYCNQNLCYKYIIRFFLRGELIVIKELYKINIS